MKFCLSALHVAVLGALFVCLAGCGADAVVDQTSSGATVGDQVEVRANEASSDGDERQTVFGKEEFGLTGEQLARCIVQAEQKIGQCMKKKGFKYTPVDVATVFKGMSADKNYQGLTEEQFTAKYGFGVATLYTGESPQLSDGYSPAREGLGETNVAYFQSLSPANQVAYNRALFGTNEGATLAVAIETEDVARCGGCTMEAIKAAFPKRVYAGGGGYYNPLDAKVNEHWLMQRALKQYREEMRAAGFDYNHPDEVEPDIRKQLDAITGGQLIPIDQLPTAKRTALDQLKAYELKVARIHYKLATKIFDPIEERVQKEILQGE